MVFFWEGSRVVPDVLAKARSGHLIKPQVVGEIEDEGAVAALDRAVHSLTHRVLFTILVVIKSSDPAMSREASNDNASSTDFDLKQEQICHVIVLKLHIVNLIFCLVGRRMPHLKEVYQFLDARELQLTALIILRLLLA